MEQFLWLCYKTISFNAELVIHDPPLVAQGTWPVPAPERARHLTVFLGSMLHSVKSWVKSWFIMIRSNNPIGFFCSYHCTYGELYTMTCTFLGFIWRFHPNHSGNHGDRYPLGKVTVCY